MEMHNPTLIRNLVDGFECFDSWQWAHSIESYSKQNISFFAIVNTGGGGGGGGSSSSSSSSLSDLTWQFHTATIFAIVDLRTIIPSEF
jgi:hypothetical protein